MPVFNKNDLWKSPLKTGLPKLSKVTQIGRYNYAHEEYSVLLYSVHCIAHFIRLVIGGGVMAKKDVLSGGWVWPKGTN